MPNDEGFMLCDEADAELWKDSAEWAYSTKYDGERVRVTRCEGVHGAEVSITNRAGNDITHRYPEVVVAAKTALKRGEFDGELCVFRGGESDFLAYATRSHLENPLLIKARSVKLPATLVVFDAVEIDGVWVASLPLEARLTALDKGVRECERIKRAEGFADFRAAWSEVKARNLEGVIAKRRGSPYEARRSSAWVKLKNWRYIDHTFTDYETHNKGITLDDGQHRVSVSGEKCRECLLALEGGGKVRVKVRYLVGYEVGWRQPTIAEVLG